MEKLNCGIFKLLRISQIRWPLKLLFCVMGIFLYNMKGLQPAPARRLLRHTYVDRPDMIRFGDFKTAKKIRILDMSTVAKG